jgi:hypothetical protein
VTVAPDGLDLLAEPGELDPRARLLLAAVVPPLPGLAAPDVPLLLGW